VTAHELTTDGRANTVCVAFFCVRLRGTAGGGWPPVWCSRRRRRVRAPLAVPSGKLEQEIRKREHTDDDGGGGAAKPPETVAGATAADACLRFADRDVRTANALYAAYSNK